MPDNKDVVFRGARRRLCLKEGINTCAGGDISLSFQLFDPVGE